MPGCVGGCLLDYCQIELVCKSDSLAVIGVSLTS